MVRCSQRRLQAWSSPYRFSHSHSLQAKLQSFKSSRLSFPPAKSQQLSHRSWGRITFPGVSPFSLKRMLGGWGPPGPFHCLSWCGPSILPACWVRHDWSPVMQPAMRGAEFMPSEWDYLEEETPELSALTVFWSTYLGQMRYCTISSCWGDIMAPEW